MTDVAVLIADMVRAGVDPEIIGRTAAALAARSLMPVTDQQAERRRAADRERKKCLRNSAESAESADPPSPPKKVSPKPPSKNNPPLPPEFPNGNSPVRDPFEEFWEAYPKREGDNPKKPALLSWQRAVKRGTDPAAIIVGARRLAVQHPIKTPYVPQAVTWLNQERWADVEPAQTGPPNGVSPFRTVEEIIASVLANDERNEGISRH